MAERAGRVLSGGRAALGFLVILVGVGALAPLLANDKPLLARFGGRMVAPAFGDLPLIGSFFEAAATRAIAWDAPPPEARSILRAPVPYSYRGIRLDESLRPPSARHLLGTDALGRDLLARLIYGARSSLTVGLVATAVALLLGSLLGSVAALRGGAADLAIIRFADVVASFPPFVLALAFVAASGRSGLAPIVGAIALSRWTGAARYVRGEILRHTASELWAAARATGGSLPRLAVRHLLPLLASPLAVMAAFGVANAILLESGLSFLGLGVEPPTPSWGGILAEARATLDSAWWPVFFPSAALLAVLGSLGVAGEAASSGGQDPEGGRA